MTVDTYDEVLRSATAPIPPPLFEEFESWTRWCSERMAASAFPALPGWVDVGYLGGWEPSEDGSHYTRFSSSAAQEFEPLEERGRPITLRVEVWEQVMVEVEVVERRWSISIQSDFEIGPVGAVALASALTEAAARMIAAVEADRRGLLAARVG